MQRYFNIKTVIIIGGGIAGLAAAIRLAEQGYKIKLIEKRPVLGGRASSFTDPDTGEPVDNCQHVLMKCCTNLLDFYKRLGVENHIHWFNRFHFIGKDNRISEIYASNLPAPFHLLPSFLKFSALNLRDKLGIAYAFFCMQAQDEALHPELDKVSIDRWLREHYQTERAIDTFWRPTLVSALNEEIEISSAKYAFKLFRTGFLKDRSSYEMGVPTIRLSELYSEPSIDFLAKYGGEVILKKSVAEINVENDTVTGVRLTDGSILSGDYYISAVTFDILLNILPKQIVEKETFFSNIRKLNVSPITGIHFWFDRAVTPLDHASIPYRTIQWMFNKTRNFEMGKSSVNDPSYLGLVVSASKNLMAKSRDEIVKMALDEVHEIFPESKNANLLKSIVIKEHKATFSPSPGCDAYRPDSISPLSNFFIAGDWTKTDWPGTMESAVISGYRCAKAISERGS